MQREKGKMFAAFTGGIVLCSVVLIGMYFWALRGPAPEKADLPSLAAISEEEAKQILQGEEYPEGDVRRAAERTALFGRNIQFLALKEKYRRIIASFFSETDAPIMEEWLKRNWKLVWVTLLQGGDRFNFRLNLDEYDLQKTACTWTYRVEPIDANSRNILEDSLTVTMTLAVKDAVRKAELQWPVDFRWGYIASVKLQFVIEQDNVRSVTIDVEDLRRKDLRGDHPIDHEKLQEDMTKALQAVFRSDGHPGWVYLSYEKEMNEYHWKGIP